MNNYIIYLKVYHKLCMWLRSLLVHHELVVQWKRKCISKHIILSSSLVRLFISLFYGTSHSVTLRQAMFHPMTHCKTELTFECCFQLMIVLLKEKCFKTVTFLLLVIIFNEIKFFLFQFCVLFDQTGYPTLDKNKRYEKIDSVYRLFFNHNIIWTDNDDLLS